jgi:hypothetical protein
MIYNSVRLRITSGVAEGYESFGIYFGNSQSSCAFLQFLIRLIFVPRNFNYLLEECRLVMKRFARPSGPGSYAPGRSQVPDKSKAKCNTWSFRLGAVREANSSTLQKSGVMKPPEIMEERRARPIDDCSPSIEEEEEERIMRIIRNL